MNYTSGDSITRADGSAYTLNEDESAFINSLTKKLRNNGITVPLTIDVIGKSTLNFKLNTTQLGRIDLSGDDKSMQIISEDDITWIKDITLKKAYRYSNDWVEYAFSVFVAKRKSSSGKTGKGDTKKGAAKFLPTIIIVGVAIIGVFSVIYFVFNNNNNNNAISSVSSLSKEEIQDDKIYTVETDESMDGYSRSLTYKIYFSDDYDWDSLSSGEKISAAKGYVEKYKKHGNESGYNDYEVYVEGYTASKQKAFDEVRTYTKGEEDVVFG